MGNQIDTTQDDAEPTDATAAPAPVLQGETLDDLAAEVAGQDAERAAMPENPEREPDAQMIAYLEMGWSVVLTMFAPNWLRVYDENRAALAQHGIEQAPAPHRLALGFEPLFAHYFPNVKPSGPWADAFGSLAEFAAPALIQGEPLKLKTSHVASPAAPNRDDNPDTGA